MKGESAAFHFCEFAFDFCSMQMLLRGRGKPLSCIHSDSSTAEISPLCRKNSSRSFTGLPVMRAIASP